jgi:hypothetical protein
LVSLWRRPRQPAGQNAVSTRCRTVALRCWVADGSSEIVLTPGVDVADIGIGCGE